MASISYNIPTTAQSLYKPFTPFDYDFSVPYFDSDYYCFRSTNISFNPNSNQVTIGGLGDFDNDGQRVRLGNESTTTSYLRLDVDANRLYIGGSTIFLDNINTPTTSGTPSGKYLPLTINGTIYKLLLLNN